MKHPCINALGVGLVCTLAAAGSATAQTTVVVDTPWIKSNAVLDFNILETALPDHPAWTYTSQVWDGTAVGVNGCHIPDWQPGYWAALDHLGLCFEPATHQWFRTILELGRLQGINRIELIGLHKSDDRIGVNDNIYVWVNPLTHSVDEIAAYGGTSDSMPLLPFPQELKDRLDSSPLHGEGKACGGPDGVPETAWNIETLNLPLGLFHSGPNLVDVLLEELCIDGGLSHLAFRLETGITAQVPPGSEPGDRPSGGPDHQD